MKYSCTVPCMIFTILLSWVCHPAAGQTTGDGLNDSIGIYSLVQNTYGSDQVLINGIYHENYYLNALGHPFLMENRFYPGSVVIHNKLYRNLTLKFNIYDQNIVIRQNLNNNNPVEFEPPVAFISEFMINDMHFKKLKDETGKDRFFQVVYDGNIKLLNAWSKQRVVSFHNVRLSSYRFDEEVKKSFILIGQRLCRFNSSGSFLNLFPKELLPEIKSYCRKESIRPGKGPDENARKLTAFCDGLMKKNVKAIPGQPKRTY